MKLVIDISEEDYDYIKNSDDMNFNVIKNGIPLEEELEDVKAEIENYEIEIFDYSYSQGLKKAIEIIDKHISELKGENNGDTQ